MLAVEATYRTLARGASSEDRDGRTAQAAR